MILTPSHYQQYLSAEAQALERIDLLVERAELLILTHYAENGRVALRGLDEMDEDLLHALRTTIALVVEHLALSPDPYVKAFRRGERSVTYANRQRLMPLGWGFALWPYDETEPLYCI